MADLFEEVEEQLRSHRYKTLALKAAPWVVGALLAALVAALAIWGWQTYTQRAANKASENYAAALEAFSQGRNDEAFRLWGEVAQSPSKGYASLALMHQGAVRLEAGKTQEAVKLFDEAAAKAPNPVIADAARLKSAFALLDTAPYKDMEARLTPLLKDDRPFRVEAREALAFSKLMAGDQAGARGDFVVLSLLSDASEGARQRAKAAIELIDSGGTKAIPAAVKAASLLPPPVQLPPGALPPGLEGAAAPQQQTPGPQ